MTEDISFRTERAKTVRAERRRRDDATIDGGQRKKLAIPPEVEARLKAEGREPRWALDTDNRIYQLTELDDYDRVEEVAPVPVVVDRKTGEVANQILLSKPKAFIEQDRAKADVARRKGEHELMLGQSKQNQTAARDDVYAAEGNQISHGGP